MECRRVIKDEELFILRGKILKDFICAACCLMLLLPMSLWGQSVVDELTSEDSVTTQADLVTERIQKVSDSKRIFILTNSNGVLNKGDFFSILINNKLVSRALVAKKHDGVVGIKNLKIYSISRWELMKSNIDVQILKGDDSYFMKTPKQEESMAQEDSKINSEEDLYREELMLADGSLMDEKNNRSIKTDNIVGASWGNYGAYDTEGSKISFSHWGVSWGYQVTDNIWGEFFYGISTMPDYPAGDLETVVNNYSVRLKYCLKAPFYSFLMPYVGYQMTTVDSPEAGMQDANNNRTSTQLALESEVVDDLVKKRVVFGVTVLRRLVPGWFARADIGTDIINIGLALEF